MKTISKIFGLMLTVAVIFSSCGNDDNDGPTPEPKEKDVTYTYTTIIKGLAPISEGKTEYNLPDLTLAQILGETDAKNLLSAEFQNTGGYIEISGLKNMTTDPALTNFTLQVNSNTPVNFGTCKINGGSGNNEFSSDTQQSGNKYVTFMSSIFSGVVSKSQKVSLKVSFTPTKDILESNNVVLKIVIRGIYRYNTYPSTVK